MLKVVSLVFFHFQDPIKGLRKLDVKEQFLEHEMPMKEMLRNQQIMTLTGKYQPSTTRNILTWMACPQSPWAACARENMRLDAKSCQVASQYPGSLVFNTTVGRVRFKHNTRDIYKKAVTRHRDVSLCTPDGTEIGRLHRMSGEWIDEHVGTDRLYDVLVICGKIADFNTRKIRGFALGDFDSWRLQVMLIERMPEEVTAYCVRRVGVGYVGAHKWKDCDTRWESVVLC